MPSSPASSPDPASSPQSKQSASSINEHQPRTLILCFDGTDSQFDGNNTNAVKFYSLLKKDDDNQQLCYYQPGVGTYLNPGVVSPFFQWAAKILDEAFAWYLDSHVRGGYQFLMQNYNPGDKISLFGFSRGAYTARALAGMLHKIGLLPRDNPEQIPFAYKLYTKTDKDSLALAAGFKQTFCRTVKIEFVGVWETVSSVGVLMSRTLPFTSTNATIKKFRHALALDEHRVRFLPNYYHRNSPDASSTSSDKRSSRVFDVNDAQRYEGNGNAGSQKVKKSVSSVFKKSQNHAAAVEKVKLQQEHQRLQASQGAIPSTSNTSSLVGKALNDHIDGGTDVLEVWFAGCHGDVGGGSVDDDVELSLSDITLRWMVREVVQAQCGIAFDQEALTRANIPESIFRGTGFALPAQTTISGPGSPRSSHRHGFVVQDDPGTGANGAAGESTANDGADPLAKVQPSPGSSEGGGPNSDPLGTAADALQPIHDALKRTPTWWLLEIVPTWWNWQDADGKWKTTFWFHMGRGRQIPLDAGPPKFHVSVRERMQDPGLKYKPRAQWKSGSEVYVD